jgi:hypothetical protein
MKKSVNGKSFDEIFGQRGKEVESPSIGGIYFSFIKESQSLSAIVKVYKLQKEELDFYASYILWADGNFWTKQKHIYGGEPVLFEATPDQIDLLNAYKNE